MRRLTLLTVQIIVMSLLFWGLTLSIQAAPKADLWPRWQQHDPQSSKTIDYTLWDIFLKKYLVSPHPSGINRVRYDAVVPEDRQDLQRYIDTLQTIQISTYNRQEQKAYWINLYNALTILVILQHYPVESIRDIDISPGWFSDGPWGAKLVTIEGEKLSLDNIEHRILRPIWKDNRVHYAVNCASFGCPNLAPVAYTAENLEQLLDQGAREYVNHPRGVTLKEGKLQVSSIYIWFQEDFEGSTDGVLAHLRQYADGQLVEKLQSYRGSVKHDYDWRLNSF
ncbi:MAG: DUF547 domain-containing protein [Candidatus Tectomicrobia bacterium]|nr:DUF547 domain-containing protein [Candidatus Tectomicrobia bacterium]